MHKEKFFNFIKELNENNVKYYFLRGFINLPEKPDTDIDLVCHMSDWDRFNGIASKHLRGEGFKDYGFAEYCNMFYYPYFTPGPEDRSIPNGRFRVDSYNCLHMSSPLNSFATNWTLPILFDDYVFDKRIKIEYDIPYYIPSVECEIVLLVLRNILDMRGAWKAKHIKRIDSLKHTSDKQELLRCIDMVLPHAQAVADCIHNNEYKKIFNLVMEK
jgi:hypothetical protein